MCLCVYLWPVCIKLIKLFLPCFLLPAFCTVDTFLVLDLLWITFTQNCFLEFLINWMKVWLFYSTSPWILGPNIWSCFMTLTSRWGDSHQYEVAWLGRLLLTVLELFSHQSQNLSDAAGQAAADGHVRVVGCVHPTKNYRSKCLLDQKALQT